MRQLDAKAQARVAQFLESLAVASERRGHPSEALAETIGLSQTGTCGIARIAQAEPRGMHLQNTMVKVAVAITLAATASLPADAATYAIRAGRLVTDAALPARGPSTIIVDNGRITAIGVADMAVPAGATLIDMSGRTVLPGLIDAHVHLAFGPESWYAGFAPKRTAEYAVASGLHNALVTARAGFTTVRELGGDKRATIAVRDAIRDGLQDGPRILTAGPALSIIGGHGDDTVGINPDIGDAMDLAHPQIGVCTGVDGCAAATRAIAKLGVDVIKFHATGGVLDDGAKGLEQHFTDAEMKSICDTAHRLGLKVAAHAHGPRGIEAAVRAGVDSIEHGTYADAADITLMKAHGTYFVATLMAFEGLKARVGKNFYTPNVEIKANQTLSQVGKALHAAYAAGVPIALGTDAGVYEHGRNGEEVALMVSEGGMTPRDALIAATKGGATLLGIANDTGTLAVGKSADLIAVDGDPQTDPTALVRVRYVMTMGRVIPMK